MSHIWPDEDWEQLEEVADKLSAAFGIDVSIDALAEFAECIAHVEPRTLDSFGVHISIQEVAESMSWAAREAHRLAFRSVRFIPAPLRRFGLFPKRQARFERVMEKWHELFSHALFLAAFEKAWERKEQLEIKGGGTQWA